MTQMVWTMCRFVQFGADQDCYCGAEGCRQKLGNKPHKIKYSPSDAAFQLVLCEMATSSPNVRAFLYGKDVCFFSNLILQEPPELSQL